MCPLNEVRIENVGNLRRHQRAGEFAFYIVNSRGNITFEKVRQKSNEKDFIIIDSGGGHCLPDAESMMSRRNLY